MPDAGSSEKARGSRADDVVQTRVDELADKSTAGSLTVEEKAEYETYITASTLIGILRSKAHKILSTSPSREFPIAVRTMNIFVGNLVRDRADHRCEYCRLRQEHEPFLRFHIEHVIPRQHGGDDDPANLALSCCRCNFHKGPNLAGIDPDTGNIIPLFHPRRQEWNNHFQLRGIWINGSTEVGGQPFACLI